MKITSVGRGQAGEIQRSWIWDDHLHGESGWNYRGERMAGADSFSASTLINAIERKGSIKGVRIVQHCDNQRSSFNVLLRNQRKWGGRKGHWILKLTSTELEKMICMIWEVWQSERKKTWVVRERQDQVKVAKSEELFHILGYGGWDWYFCKWRTKFQ